MIKKKKKIMATSTIKVNLQFPKKKKKKSLTLEEHHAGNNTCWIISSVIQVAEMGHR